MRLVHVDVNGIARAVRCPHTDRGGRPTFPSPCVAGEGQGGGEGAAARNNLGQRSDARTPTPPSPVRKQRGQGREISGPLPCVPVRKKPDRGGSSRFLPLHSGGGSGWG